MCTFSEMHRCRPEQRTLPKGRAAGALGMQKQPPDSVATLLGRAATMQRTVPPRGGFGKGWGKWAGASRNGVR